MRTLLSIALTVLLGHGLLSTQPPPATSPEIRGGHSMTYDEARGVTLLFGGGNRERGFGDLWAWDGTRWQFLTASGPSPRNSVVFAFDSKRQRAVLHGGRTPGGLSDDTWEWDGAHWTDRKVAGPGLRLHHFGAYDARRGRLVIYGGLKPVDKRVEPLTDTWEWDGNAWTRRDTVGVDGFPSSIAYDPARGQIVLVAVDGSTPPDGEQPSSVWAWNGTRWSRVSKVSGDPALSPTQPLSPSPSGMLLLDGAMHKGNAAITWLWQDGRWTRSDAASPTPQRVSHALAYDTRRRRVVMFGGHAGFMPGRNGEHFGDTWEWSGAAWERVHPK